MLLSLEENDICKPVAEGRLPSPFTVPDTVKSETAGRVMSNVVSPDTGTEPETRDVTLTFWPDGTPLGTKLTLSEYVPPGRATRYLPVV